MFFDHDQNRMLSALSYTAASLHSSYPGPTGANELSGGGYSRQTPSIGSYSGGVRVMGSNTWGVPAGATVAWVLYWDGTTPGSCAPNGGSPKEFVASASADTISSAAHGYSDGNAIVFYNKTPPAPLVLGAVYYARDCTADTFKVAATAGGAAIDLTSAGDTGCQVSRITVQSYASADTHTITSATLGLPF